MHVYVYIYVCVSWEQPLQDIKRHCSVNERRKLVPWCGLSLVQLRMVIIVQPD